VSPVRVVFNTMSLVAYRTGVRPRFLRIGKHGNTRFQDLLQVAGRILLGLPMFACAPGHCAWLLRCHTK
jgi:hypothetical protein